MKILGRIRLFHWAILILSFFLPFCKGCNNEVVYLSSVFSLENKDFLVTIPILLIFFYPIVFLIGALLIRFIRNEQIKRKVVELIYFVGIIGIFVFLLALIKENVKQPLGESENIFLGVLLVAFAIMGFAIRRLQTIDQWQNMFAFQASFLSAGWLIIQLLSMWEDLLIGGWLSLVASSSIIITYLLEFINYLRDKRSYA